MGNSNSEPEDRVFYETPIRNDLEYRVYNNSSANYHFEYDQDQIERQRKEAYQQALADKLYQQEQVAKIQREQIRKQRMKELEMLQELQDEQYEREQRMQELEEEERRIQDKQYRIKQQIQKVEEADQGFAELLHLTNVVKLELDKINQEKRNEPKVEYNIKLKENLVSLNAFPPKVKHTPHSRTP
jgi:hypothetical protein